MIFHNDFYEVIRKTVTISPLIQVPELLIPNIAVQARRWRREKT